MIHTKKTQTISSLRRVLGWISIVGNPSKSTSHKRGGKNYQTETGQSAGGGGGGDFFRKKIWRGWNFSEKKVDEVETYLDQQPQVQDVFYRNKLTSYLFDLGSGTKPTHLHILKSTNWLISKLGRLLNINLTSWSIRCIIFEKKITQHIKMRGQSLVGDVILTSRIIHLELFKEPISLFEHVKWCENILIRWISTFQQFWC